MRTCFANTAYSLNYTPAARFSSFAISGGYLRARQRHAGRGSHFCPTSLVRFEDVGLDIDRGNRLHYSTTSLSYLSSSAFHRIFVTKANSLKGGDAKLRVLWPECHDSRAATEAKELMLPPWVFRRRFFISYVARLHSICHAWLRLEGRA